MGCCGIPVHFVSEKQAIDLLEYQLVFSRGRTQERRLGNIYTPITCRLIHHGPARQALTDAVLRRRCKKGRSSSRVWNRSLVAPIPARSRVPSFAVLTRSRSFIKKDPVAKPVVKLPRGLATL